MKYINSIKRGLDLILKVLLALGGFALLSLLGIEVFFRYVLNSALSWPGEVAGFVFVWFTLLGTALLVGEDSHIAFSLISSHIPSGIKKFLYLFTQLSIMAYAYFMIFPGFKYTQFFGFAVSPAAGISMTWLYSAVPISGILIFLYALMNITGILCNSKGEK